jgi:hypothetical protein
MIENMDDLPFVAPIYKRDLKIENYFIGYLKHPYVSLLHRPRLPLEVHLLPVAADRRRPPLPHVRSAANVLAEVKWIKENMPEVKEIMFDDDTFTDSSNLPRVQAIARGWASWA